MLVLEKDGNIRRVTNGVLAEKPVLQIKVQTESERGLLGIAATGKDVYFYLTEVSASDESVRNRIYKYHWNGENLTNPSLILDLPGQPGPNHNGRKLLIEPSFNQTGQYLYAVIGDLNHDGKLQNFKDGPDPEDTSALSDLVDNNQEFAPLIFGTGFGRITDIKTGPDGFLYILSIGDEAIYRIMPI